MPLNIKVSNFEGPFDLLLHLIKKNEMDIYNISIYEITNQYLQYLKEFKEMDLEITSEFIVVAATLLEIKSKMLLPKDKTKEIENEEVDPRKQLIEKLIEYRKFKHAAEFLRMKKNETGLIFYKKPEVIEDNREKQFKEDLFKGITMLDLYNLYNELINRYRNKLNTENIIQTQIPLDRYKVEDKMEEIKSIMNNNSRISFSFIINQCSAKLEIVVTFLALLELIKIRTVKVVQEDNFNDIHIERILSNE
jgi:segregation and condensation protein A